MVRALESRLERSQFRLRPVTLPGNNFRQVVHTQVHLWIDEQQPEIGTGEKTGALYKALFHHKVVEKNRIETGLN